VVHGSSVYDLCSQLLEEGHQCLWTLYYRFSLSAKYRGADKFLTRPTFRCILLMVKIFRLMLVLFYIYSTNIPPIVIINRTCLFVFLALQPIVVAFSQPGSGL
jgi:hypothetical protein